MSGWVVVVEYDDASRAVFGPYRDEAKAERVWQRLFDADPDGLVDVVVRLEALRRDVHNEVALIKAETRDRQEADAALQARWAEEEARMTEEDDAGV